MKGLFRNKGFTPYISIVFLNAFVDLGHKITVQNTIFKIYDGQQQIVLTAIVNAFILLPFIMMLTPSGFVSDWFPKSKVMRYTALSAVFLTLCITLFYYLGWFWPAFTMTFMLALQSAFYSPAKYGFIKEILGSGNLAHANGLVQATTIIAILAGTFVFSVLFEGFLADASFVDTSSLLKLVAPIGWMLFVLSLLEFFVACWLPVKPVVDHQLKFDWQKYTRGHYLKNNMAEVFHCRVIYLSIFGLSLFWAISQVVLAAFPAFAKESLAIYNTIIIQGTMACAGVGIMLGSVIAGQISRAQINTRFTPYASSGIAICLLVLPYLANPYLQIVNFLFWGFCGGLLLTPYNALIQYHAQDDKLGRVLAGNNFIQNITMLLFLAMTVVFAIAGISSTGLFIILLIVAIVGAVPVAISIRTSSAG